MWIVDKSSVLIPPPPILFLKIISIVYHDFIYPNANISDDNYCQRLYSSCVNFRSMGNSNDYQYFCIFVAPKQNLSLSARKSFIVTLWSGLVKRGFDKTEVERRSQQVPAKCKHVSQKHQQQWQGLMMRVFSLVTILDPRIRMMIIKLVASKWKKDSKILSDNFTREISHTHTGIHNTVSTDSSRVVKPKIEMLIYFGPKM